MDVLQRIAHTLLYEGYVLWPYRRSAIKNQQRWTFGGVYPRAYSQSSGGVDRSVVQTQCLLEVSAPPYSSTTTGTPDPHAGDTSADTASHAADAADEGAAVSVSIRFLHVIRRQIVRRVDDGGLAGEMPVDELDVAGTRYLSWDEAAERTVDINVPNFGSDHYATHPIHIAKGEHREPLFDGANDVGAIVRSWEAIDASVTVRTAALAPPPAVAQSRCAGLYRLTVAISNDSAWQGALRDEAVRRTLVSTHVVMQSHDALFASQFDAPQYLAEHSKQNINEGLWPMLVGTEGERHTMLASPIILYDYPALAPESPGDLFDGGEIDQLLILNVLTLTEEEQREMRDSDPRTRLILERCQGLSDHELARLHGTVRSLEEQTSRYTAGA